MLNLQFVSKRECILFEGVTFHGDTADKVVELLSNSGGCKQDKKCNNNNEDSEEEEQGPCTANSIYIIVVKRPSDCNDLDKSTCKSGIYKIYPEKTSGFNVFCEMKKYGGGWTVFQRRMNGKINFYRNWESYKRGFGNMEGEYWLGDAMKVHQNGKKFTTIDKDQDAHKDNCAIIYKGGWWYGACHESNLNGLYLKGSNTTYGEGVNWYQWKGLKYSLKTTTMMIRRS
ncbi:Techylectin-5B [Mytilus coruscus]|uniref:Techylectin-5B n=1 Tax=Mytilus coruscus TaxID=42192 RepID=A0A6J8AL65_MYTCO|nr:Techylectin-5B [Mytilus coruscus]